MPDGCATNFSQANTPCLDDKPQAPGSQCCNGLQALGAACLQAIQTSLSSSSGYVSALERFTGTLSSCQISLGSLDSATAPPGPASLPPPSAASSNDTPPVPDSPPASPARASNDTCLSGFDEALSSCGGSDDACCDPVRALGDDCLQELASSSDTSASGTFGQLAQTCGFNLTNAGGDKELPPGSILVAWAALGLLGAPCRAWNGTDFEGLGSTAPTWIATGRDKPTEAEIAAVGERWCSNRESAVPEMFQALDAGGRTAQIAVTTFTLYTCSTDNTELWDVMDLINSEQLNDPSTTTGYVQAMIDAADASGINFCTTVVVVSNGTTLYYKNFHTGPQADDPGGCLPNFRQAQIICSNATAPPAQPCCDAIDALGATCRASVAASTTTFLSGGSYSSAYSSIASSCGLMPGAPDTPDTPDTPGDSLPEGMLAVAHRMGRSVECYTWDVATQDFMINSSSAWAAAANNDVSASDALTFVDQVCPLADDAGPYLVQTFATGGDQAQAAVYVMSRGICPNETANGAALNAFIRECIYNMSARARILELVQSLVDAADQVGTGICVTITVMDRSSGAVLDERQIHTSVAAGGAPPMPSRRRNLRALAGNDVMRASRHARPEASLSRSALRLSSDEIVSRPDA